MKIEVLSEGEIEIQHPTQSKGEILLSYRTGPSENFSLFEEM